MRVRRSRLLPGKATVHDGWPITTAADTVLDLVAEMRSPHDVVALLTDACRSKSVTAEEILKAMGRRKRQRHRQLVKDVLADVVGGVESILEHRYLVKVERAHGLPRGRRQVKAQERTASRSAGTSTTTSSTPWSSSMDAWGTRAQAVTATVVGTTPAPCRGRRPCDTATLT